MQDQAVDTARLAAELEELRTRNAELEARLADREAVDPDFSERLHQRTAELAVVNSVQQALAAQLDMQGVVDAVGEKIREIFDAQTIYIALLDRQTNTISFPYYFEDGQQFVEAPRPLGHGLTSRVIQSRRPLVLGTLQEQIALGAVIVEPPCHSYLGVPLISGDDTIGVVSVQSYQEHAFSVSDASLLTTLAASMSVALENARLFAETKRLLAETDRRAAELALINSLQQALAAQLDMQGVVDIVGDKIREIFAAETVFVALVDHAAQTFSAPYYLYRGRRMTVVPQPLGVGLTSHVVATREPLVINEDAARRTTEMGGISVAADDEEQFWVGVPMIVGDRVIGVISLQDQERDHAYSDADVPSLPRLRPAPASPWRMPASSPRRDACWPRPTSAPPPLPRSTPSARRSPPSWTSTP